MGGNVCVYKDGIRTAAQRVNIERVGRQFFTDSVRDILREINRNVGCWSTENIESSEIFNGSSRCVFDRRYSDSEILSVRKTVGDIDVMVDLSFTEVLLKYFSASEIPEFAGFVYNREINQIHSVFRVAGFNCQIDFELSKFLRGKPTEFAKFSHYSSTADAKYRIKAVFHKFLVVAVAHTTSQDILISDYNGRFRGTEEPEFATFSVTDGFRINYVPLYDKNKKQFVTDDGRQVFVRNKRPFSTNVRRFYMYLFNTRELNKYEKFWSFTGVCELVRDTFSPDKVLEINIKFREILETQRVSHNDSEDQELKKAACQYFSSVFGL